MQAGIQRPTRPRFLNKGRCQTTVNEDPHHLQPWRTWPSFHKGMYSDDHGSFELGQDPATFRGKNIWDIAEDNGLKVGIFGPLQSWPAHEPKTAAFTFPTPSVAVPRFTRNRCRDSRNSTCRRRVNRAFRPPPRSARGKCFESAWTFWARDLRRGRLPISFVTSPTSARMRATRRAGRSSRRCPASTSTGGFTSAPGRS